MDRSAWLKVWRFRVWRVRVWRVRVWRVRVWRVRVRRRVFVKGVWSVRCRDLSKGVTAYPMEGEGREMEDRVVMVDYLATGCCWGRWGVDDEIEMGWVGYGRVE